MRINLFLFYLATIWRRLYAAWRVNRRAADVIVSNWSCFWLKMKLAIYKPEEYTVKQKRMYDDFHHNTSCSASAWSCCCSVKNDYICSWATVQLHMKSFLISFFDIILDIFVITSEWITELTIWTFQWASYTKH